MCHSLRKVCSHVHPQDHLSAVQINVGACQWEIEQEVKAWGRHINKQSRFLAPHGTLSRNLSMCESFTARSVQNAEVFSSAPVWFASSRRSAVQVNLVLQRALEPRPALWMCQRERRSVSRLHSLCDFCPRCLKLWPQFSCTSSVVWTRPL